MARNKIMGVILVISIGILMAAVLGMFRVFSYLSALLFLFTIATAVIERADSEFSLTPYTGLIAFFGSLFAVGLSGIWLLWQPGASEYTYIFGLPQPTLVYTAFLWLFPSLGAIYYSVRIFPKIGDEDIVEEILSKSHQIQRDENFPLSVEQPQADRGVSHDERGEVNNE